MLIDNLMDEMEPVLLEARRLNSQEKMKGFEVSGFFSF